MVISKETLQAHIANGDRQADAARAHGISQNRISQLVRLYELDWPRKAPHQHGEGLRPVYRKGCAQCRAIMQQVTAAYRTKKKEIDSGSDQPKPR